MKAGIDYIAITTPFYCNDGKGNFILHKRSVNCRDEKGTWDTGGGQLEFGQTLEESVLREVKEEYGCHGKIQEALPPYTLFRKNGEKKTHWLAVPFFILVYPDEVKNGDPEKIAEIGWFKFSSLPKPLHPGLMLVLKKYKKSFNKYK